MRLIAPLRFGAPSFGEAVLAIGAETGTVLSLR